MKKYIKLTVDFEAYYSGATYFEEVFLPLEVWNEIKDGFRGYIWLHEMDGKHSESQVDIEIEEVDESDLEDYMFQNNDDGKVIDLINDYLPEDYPFDYMWKMQGLVHSLSQVEEINIKINKNNKDIVLKLIEYYLVGER